jgi:hypothetical protein
MHYGVKGMHWGIRRYQPYTSNPRKNGVTGVYKPKAISGKRGKAEVWKARESDRQANRYNRKINVIDSYISEKQTKLTEAKKNGASDRKIAKLEKRVSYGKMQKRINEKLKKAELNKIAKMSIKDVSKARLDKGMHYTGQILKSTAVKAVTSAALAGAIGAFVESGANASTAKTAIKNSRQALVDASRERDFAGQARRFADQITTHNKNYANGYITNGMRGNLSIRGMDAKDWMNNAKEHDILSKLSMMDEARLGKVAAKAAAVSDAMAKVGFGLSATAVGAAATNFTRLGRINEYSTLSRKERKSIVKKEREAYKKRWK